VKKNLLFLILLIFSLSSCIEILDDLTIHTDGSGTLRYNINLSSNKIKVNSILALDSLDGQKVPKIEDIKEKVQQFIKTLDAQNGISNVKIEENYTDFILKFSCDFTNVLLLQEGIKATISSMTKEKNISELNHNWITWDGTKLSRSIPDITLNKVKELNQSDLEQLKQGTYTSISRFDKAVEKIGNPAASLSKNKLAVMIKTDTYSLKENSSILENVIYLISNKN
jgi:hypothetical protein